MSKEQEEAKKKWHIDRVQTLVGSYVEKFESERGRFRSWIVIVENELTTLKNILVGGGAAPVPLILALYSRGFLVEWMAATLLVADLILIPVAFVLLTFWRNKVRNLLLIMDSGYSLAATQLEDLHNLFIKEAYPIDEIEDDRIRFFWAYLAFASLAVRVYLIDVFNDMYKSRIFWRIKPLLWLYLQRHRVTMTQAQQAYIDENSVLKRDSTRYNSDLQRLNPYLEEFFNYDSRKERAIEEEGVAELLEEKKKQEEEGKNKKKKQQEGGGQRRNANDD